MRTTQNGTQDPVTARVCSLDGAHMTYQLKECSRKEEKVVYISPTPEQIEKYETPLQEVDATDDGMLIEYQYTPPVYKEEKKKGWPKGKKRGT